MAKKPLVSIVIPAYNSARYIGRTVTFALATDYPNLEVVVVDDCSTDDTLKVLELFEDKRLRVIRNKENLGMTGNWNKCVRSARGEYVKLIPADDLVYPECVERSVRLLLRHPDIKLVVTGTDLIDEKDQTIGSYLHWPVRGVFEGRRLAKPSMILNNFYGNPVCAMFRKEDFETVGGFDPDFPYILDFDLWLALSSLGRVAVIPEHLNAFRVRTDSNSGQMMGGGEDVYTAEHIRLFDKYSAGKAFPLNRFERGLAILTRKVRNVLIGLFIRVKGKKK